MKEQLIIYADTETVTLSKSECETIRLKDAIIQRRAQEISRADCNNPDYALVVPQSLQAVSDDGSLEIYDDTLSSFFCRIAAWVKNKSRKSVRVYFHNMKYDGEMIVNWGLYGAFSMKASKRLIRDGRWYEYSFCAYGVQFTLWDSYKLLSIPLKEFGKAFHLPKNLWKLEENFENLTTKQKQNRLDGKDEKLKEYAMRDVYCLRAGMQAIRKELGNLRMTAAGLAFATWQGTDHAGQVIPLGTEECRKKTWKGPVLTEEEQIAADYTYQGAICYANPRHVGKDINGKFVYIDNNSLYPSSALSESAGRKHYYPVSVGRYFEGEPVDFDRNDITKYYTFHVMGAGKFKKNVAIPFLRLGKVSRLAGCTKRIYKQNEFLSEFDDEFWINSIDLRLLYQYYDVKELKIIEGWEYDCALGVFDEFVNKYGEMKVNAAREGNAPQKFIAKLQLNSMLGKFGQRIDDTEETEYMKEDGAIGIKRERRGKAESFNNMPIVSALLAYARETLLSVANNIPAKDFYYSDTDSVIMTKKAFDKYVPKNQIDSAELGLWDIEHRPIRVKILRQKTYMFTEIVEINGEKKEAVKVTCAGAKAEAKKLMTYDNFYIGSKIGQQLKPRAIAGGLALIPVPFEIQEHLGFCVN